MLQTHGGPVYVLSPDARLVDVNAVVERVLGYERDAILTMSWLDVVAPGEVERLPSGKGCSPGGAVVHRPDADRPRQLPTPRQHPPALGGRVTGAIGMTEDVTDLSDAAFDAEALRTVTDRRITPVAMFDAESLAPLYSNDTAGLLTCSGRPTGPAGAIVWSDPAPAIREALPEPGEARHVCLASHGASLPSLAVTVEVLAADHRSSWSSPPWTRPSTRTGCVAPRRCRSM